MKYTLNKYGAATGVTMPNAEWEEVRDELRLLREEKADLRARLAAYEANAGQVPEDEKTANIVAAAPLMLLTLKDIYSFLRRSGYDTRIVKAAIDQAEGNEPLVVLRAQR